MNAGTIILIEPNERVNQANDSPQEDPPTNTSRVGDPDESSRHSLDTTTSSVPPLPSPIQPLNQEGASNDNSHLIESHESFDTLFLEIEVQNLIELLHWSRDMLMFFKLRRQFSRSKKISFQD